MSSPEIKPVTLPARDGEAFYVPVEQVRPGQSRYSSQNVDEKVAKLVEKLSKKGGTSASTEKTPPLEG